MTLQERQTRIRLSAVCLAACWMLGAAALVAEQPYRKDELLYRDDFAGDLSEWVVEQMPGGTAEISDGKLEIKDKRGCTIWFRHRLESPVMIEYQVVIVKQGGPFDRGSDLNCFWMAIDPEHPDDIFENSEARGGSFKNYHPLRLYYVGYGANNNTTTRFRRYPGDGTRPMLPEHDLHDESVMLTYNEPINIQLVACNQTIQYFRNGEIIYDVTDPKPFTSGWFGFRTVRNHMTIDHFRVYRLKTP